MIPLKKRAIIYQKMDEKQSIMRNKDNLFLKQINLTTPAYNKSIQRLFLNLKTS